MPDIMAYGEVNESSSCGAKAKSLIHLGKNHVNIPDGFVLSYGVFEKYKADHSYVDVIADKIHDSYKGLSKRSGHSAVAVRSSASVEDSNQASFAGLFETFLNVDGIENVIYCVKKCFDALDAKVLDDYAQKRNIDKHQLRLSLIIQSMVKPLCSGVMFTKHPYRNDNMVIESNLGLAQSVVTGAVVPDYYEIDLGADEYHITSKIGTKEFSFSVGSNELVEQRVSKERQSKSSLTRENLEKLIALGTELENHFGQPQDIEWTLSEDKTIVVLQSRPITIGKTMIL